MEQHTETQNPNSEIDLARDEQVRDGADLYHVTGWEGPAELRVGESFILNPGRQNAQGEGVYFSEEQPRFSAAEGTNGNPQAVIHIKGGLKSEGWYRSKAAFSEKYRYPRTRHTKGQSIKLTIVQKEFLETELGQIPILHCDYEMIPTVTNCTTRKGMLNETAVANNHPLYND